MMKSFSYETLTMKETSLVKGNSPLSFSLKFLRMFVCTPSVQSLERYFPPAELEYMWFNFGQRWCQKCNRGQSLSWVVEGCKGSKTNGLTVRWRQEYNEKNNKVKQSVREDKRRRLQGCSSRKGRLEWWLILHFDWRCYYGSNSNSHRVAKFAGFSFVFFPK